jgi:hypothetical protein
VRALNLRAGGEGSISCQFLSDPAADAVASLLLWSLLSAIAIAAAELLLLLLILTTLVVVEGRGGYILQGQSSISSFWYISCWLLYIFRCSLLFLLSFPAECMLQKYPEVAAAPAAAPAAAAAAAATAVVLTPLLLLFRAATPECSGPFSSAYCR